MKEALCLFFEIDGDNCDSVVTLTPGGPICWNHQKEMWRSRNR